MLSLVGIVNYFDVWLHGKNVLIEMVRKEKVWISYVL